MFNEKFRMPVIKLGNPFLPSPDEVSEFLGLPVSPREKIKWLNASVVKSKLPTDRTLDNISKDGIRWTSIRQFAWQLARVFVRKGWTFDLSLSNGGIHKADLSFWWSNTLKGIQQGLSSTSSELNIGLLVSYIDRRCAAYQRQLAFMLDAPNINENNQNELISGYYLPVLDFTLLSEREKALVKNWLKSPSEFTSQETEQAMLCFYHDFWLSLMSVIDAMFLEDWDKHYEEYTPSVYAQQYGVFGQVFNREERTFLGKFFGLIKEQTNQTYAQLSEYVALPFSEHERNGLLKRDVQQARFKEWRSGKSLPSVEALSTFFANMDAGRQGVDLLIYALFMRALDKVGSSFLPDIYTTSRYQRYFQHYAP
ncbi:hypothetical protein [Vibrio vulnificus]|uniref:hypothetical protein n=2 Tax=Vibrio vulnificus TaxID=672 RepID=UPI00050046F0|nr:hypothetical protein [Vibrio vulnificus]ASJ39690.1 hypothetical protein VVCECT4999_13715 [Vibrio vulnificus]EGR0353728.1 hypothetical protein [Vibrio vulnificus]EGR0638962.1 hypothetical protein [Vibrio vulnificus]EGR0647942.1 hypothetical protein [Vibrio vulnificus]EID4441162.1 hypothetical protein [Vibrio vulnificus]